MLVGILRGTVLLRDACRRRQPERPPELAAVAAASAAAPRSLGQDLPLRRWVGDAAETCDGAATTCPPNALRRNTYTCRAASCAASTAFAPRNATARPPGAVRAPRPRAARCVRRCLVQHDVHCGRAMPDSRTGGARSARRRSERIRPARQTPSASAGAAPTGVAATRGAPPCESCNLPGSVGSVGGDGRAAAGRAACGEAACAAASATDPPRPCT